jgi:hypothetical protein
MPKSEIPFEKACAVLGAIEEGYSGPEINGELHVSKAFVSRIRHRDPKILTRYPELHPIPPKFPFPPRRRRARPPEREHG